MNKTFQVFFYTTICTYIIIYIALLYCIINFSNYTILKYYISDLGQKIYPKYYIFNATLFLSGIILLIGQTNCFGNFLVKGYVKSIFVINIICNICFTLIGIFPVDSQTFIHSIIAGILFCSIGSNNIIMWNDAKTQNKNNIYIIFTKLGVLIFIIFCITATYLACNMNFTLLLLDRSHVQLITILEWLLFGFYTFDMIYFSRLMYQNKYY